MRYEDSSTHTQKKNKKTSLLGTQTSKGTGDWLRFYNLKKQQIRAKYGWALSHMK